MATALAGSQWWLRDMRDDGRWSAARKGRCEGKMARGGKDGWEEEEKKINGVRLLFCLGRR